MDSAEELTVLSLCTGFGGIELGLERLGFRLRPLAYVERSAFAAARLVASIEEERDGMAAAPVHTDVATFPYHLLRGRVDILIAGFNCQPYTKSGERKGSADDRYLWRHIANGIAACEPCLVFLENVEGHVTLGLRDTLQDLGRMGYRTTWGLFAAAEVGSPQERRRLFILADSGSARGKAWLSRSQQRKEGNTEVIDHGGGRDWPMGIGREQHEWEEPRTIVGKPTALNPDWCEQMHGLDVGWTQLPTGWSDSG